MTDDLRTRISDAIWGEARTIGSTLSGKAADLIADAVIRELGLRRQFDWEDDSIELVVPTTHHRYVTEWTTE